MKQFKAHIQDGERSRQNHFKNPECELPFSVPREASRTLGQSVTRAGAVQCGLTCEVRGSNGKWQGRINHATEPLEPKYRLLNVGQLTGVQKIRNCSALLNIRSFRSLGYIHASQGYTE